MRLKKTIYDGLRAILVTVKDILVTTATNAQPLKV